MKHVPTTKALWKELVLRPRPSDTPLNCSILRMIRWDIGDLISRSGK